MKQDEDVLPHAEDDLVDLAAVDEPAAYGLETHHVAVKRDGTIEIRNAQGDVLDHSFHGGLLYWRRGASSRRPSPWEP